MLRANRVWRPEERAGHPPKQPCGMPCFPAALTGWPGSAIGFSRVCELFNQLMPTQRSPNHQRLRELFLLRPDVVFLNHGSYGACPRSVLAAYQDWQLKLEQQPVEFLSRRFKDLMQWAREVLAEFVGSHPDEVVYVPNVTTGLNIVARSLRLGPGDEVLGTDHEYGAIDRTWRFICARRGARYIRAQLPRPVQSKEQVADAIWAHVTTRTRVLFISHITAPTALILPVELLIPRARQAGILTVLDGAHSPGQMPLNLTDLGADFYVGNCHKWMCAPKGSAFLYARRDVHPLLTPLVVSWGWEPERPGPSRFIDEHEWQGTRDVAAFLAVPAAIKFLREYNWTKVQQECHALARTARQGIEAMTGLPGLSPDSSAWYRQMVSVPLPVPDATVTQQSLYAECAVEVPITPWNGQALLRVSIQGYNTAEDVEALLAAVAQLLETDKTASGSERSPQ